MQFILSTEPLVNGEIHPDVLEAFNEVIGFKLDKESNDFFPIDNGVSSLIAIGLHFYNVSFHKFFKVIRER